MNPKDSVMTLTEGAPRPAPSQRTLVRDPQWSLEETCLQAGVNAYRQHLEAARKAGREDQSLPGRRLVKNGVLPTREAIIAWVVETRKGPGRNAAVLRHVEALDADVAALVALSVIVGGSSRDRSVQSVAFQIGSDIENALKLEAWKVSDEKDHGGAKNYIAQSPLSTNEDYRRKALLWYNSTGAGPITIGARETYRDDFCESLKQVDEAQGIKHDERTIERESSRLPFGIHPVELHGSGRSVPANAESGTARVADRQVPGPAGEPADALYQRRLAPPCREVSG
jgi:hypothetical protein